MTSLLVEARSNLFNSLTRRPILFARLFSFSANDDFIHERIPRSKNEFNRRQSLPVNQPVEPKLNRVTIIGLPNSGKSTLVNQLIGSKVSSVSKKVHTTRKNIIGVFNEGSTQVELLDTPGLVKLKHCVDFNLEHTLYHNPRLSAKVADMIAVLVDASQKRYRNFIDYETFKILSKHKDKKSILVLNKVDKIEKKRILLDIVDRLTGNYIEGQSIEGKERFSNCKERSKSINELIAETEKRLSSQTNIDEEGVPEDSKKALFDLHWPNFSKVFMISALTGDGVDELRDYMIQTAKPCLWKYNSTMITNQDPQSLAISIVREKFLDHGYWDTPYLLKFFIEAWELDEMNNIHIIIVALCPKNNKMTSIIGPEGATIARISAEARQELMDTFNCQVRLKVVVKCTEKIDPKESNKEE